MTIKQYLSAAVLGILLNGAAAAPAGAQQPASPHHGPLDYGAISRAVTNAVSGEATRPTGAPKARTAVSKQSSNGSNSSGGGHTALIVSLVGAAAGIGATVYMVHQMQKDTTAATATLH